MKTLKQILYPYVFTKGEEDRIIKAIKEWLTQKRQEPTDPHEPNGANRVVNELIKELEE